MSYRSIIRYSQNFGLRQFTNPTTEGPLSRVKFCSVDSMFHLFFRYSPFEDDADLRKISHIVHSSIDYKDNPALVQRSRYKLRTDRPEPRILDRCHASYEDRYEDDHIMSIWTITTDLQSLPEIVESIPELEAGWVRGEIEKLKAKVCLGVEDPPQMDADYNEGHDRISISNSVRVIRAWYRSALLSGKGGTLYFTTETPPEVLDDIRSKFQDAGADARLIEGAGHKSTSLRIEWVNAMSGFAASKKQVRAILGLTQGALSGLDIRVPF